ncbi:ribonuclease HII [Patescibacteria group bacterium]|nr:ribonuclease HII [Patescibacteria group bacterium]MBU1501069.1 ribonuclease HII [Patescibacteria group bacterium]MBU2081058.1 ribonuclease HII [Patescibacteria group bacterium]MBU2124149.1 ribonuclease HII [Patescibacteria group bacterium]MBU2195005.1 ribonuclease HII [Patescibacteria group bacterium]
MKLVGVDEAGRGPIAGPVAVGAVCVPEEYPILDIFPGLNDSKKLSEKKREALFLILQEEIRKGGISATVCLSSAKMIDEKGIAYAVRHALNRGVTKLLPDSKEGKVFLDGSLHAPEEYVQETVIGGDGTVPVIMLASIAAKVTRDRLMKKRAEEYPEYSFETHKGYGTKAHYAALRAHGLCLEHRASFIHL